MIHVKIHETLALFYDCNVRHVLDLQYLHHKFPTWMITDTYKTKPKPRSNVFIQGFDDKTSEKNYGQLSVEIELLRRLTCKTKSSGLFASFLGKIKILIYCTEPVTTENNPK